MLRFNKFFSFLMSALLVFSLFGVACYAESADLTEDELLSENSTGFISHTDLYDYNVIEVNPDELGSYRFGDLDANNRITAKDARLALRAAAKLETLTERQLYAADVFGDGIIDALDDTGIPAKNARKILRVSAGLEKMDSIKATIELGESYVIKGFKHFDWSANWVFECDKSSQIDLKVNLYKSNITTDRIPGFMSCLEFVVIPKEKGTYTLNVCYKESSGIEPFKNCSETITLEVI